MNIFFDTESSGLSPFTDKLTLLQLNRGGMIQIKFPTPKIMQKLKAILEEKNNLTIGQNLKHELKFLMHQHGIIPSNIFDTQIAEIVLSGGLLAGMKGTTNLSALIKKYTGIEIKKDAMVQQSFNGETLTSEQIQYASDDVRYLPQIYEAQNKALDAEGLHEVFDREMRCVYATTWLELSGLPVDLTELEAFTQTIEQIKEMRRIHALLLFKEMGVPVAEEGLPSINLRSVPQLKNALKTCGIIVEKTDKYALADISHPIGQALLQFKRASTQIGFLEAYPKFINTTTNRIHPAYNQYGAATGRFTSNKPNMQQVPADKEVRGLFRTNNGNSIIVGDYSQIELRIIGELSQEPEFIRIYQADGDLHRKTASIVMHKPEEEISNDERSKAKAINFGFSYGMGVKRFIENAKTKYGMQFTEQEGYKLQQNFFTGYPVLKRYLATAGKQARQQRYIRNRAGRLVMFESGLEDWQYENLGRNNPIQSLNADIMKGAMGLIFDQFYGSGVKLINQVHDELVFEVPAAHAEQIAGDIKEIMEASGRKYLKTVPVKVDLKISDRWVK